MSRWFRMYDELLDDPKVQKLPAEDFRGWVNLLCLASKNDGKLPPLEDISFALRQSKEAVSTLVERLRNAGLIERHRGGANGAFDAPYKWDERQYKSDTSTERVKRFRKRCETVAETPSDTETETYKKKEPNGSSKERAFPEPDGVTAEQWAAFKAQRKKKLNARAYQLLCNKLSDLAEHGWPPGQMVDLAIERGWETVFAPRDSSNVRRTDSMGRHQPADGLSSTARAAVAVFGAPPARNDR